MKEVYLFGGDKRFSHLEKLLISDGYAVRSLFRDDDTPPEAFPHRPVLCVFPYPVSKKSGVLYAPLYDKPVSLVGVMSALTNCTVLSGGGKQYAEGCEHFIDYSLDEEYLRANAALTAEGTVMFFLQTSERAISDSKILITGYGRVAQETAQLFYAMGAEVTVVARNTVAREQAEKHGYLSADIAALSKLSREAHAVINTVPARIIKTEEYHARLYIELASAPYGADIEALKETGHIALLAQSLPGRVLPESAARTLYRVVADHL